MVAEIVPQQHPILACASTALAALGSVRDVQPVFMRPADQRSALEELTRVERVLAELKLRVLAAAEQAAQDSGARDAGVWLAHLTQADITPARAEAHLAQALDRRWAVVASGMADGAVSREQARVVAASLDNLPDDLDPEVVDKAEAQLTAWCAQFRPSELRRLGRHILDVVAPDIADREEAKRLEQEEQRAREKSSVRIRRLGDGATRTTIVHSDAEADRLLTYLDTFTSPRQGMEAVSGEADRIPQHRKRGHAFGALLEHLAPAALPAHGGDATTVLVTVTLDALRAELATAGMIDGDLSTGPNLTASETRRLACNAQIIPVVLGSDSEILDLGRSSRLFKPAQRKAMRLRDQRCRAETCTIPATWCEAHHWKPWSEGGSTDLADGVLLCSWHHHRAHDRRYQADRLPNGDVRFHRRR